MNSSFSNSHDHHAGVHHQPHTGVDTGGLFNQIAEALFSGETAANSVVGTPNNDAQDWVHQTTPFTCDVVSQEMILHEFGIDVSEAQLVYEATQHGWLTDGGTSFEDMAKLLELHGVDTHAVQNGSLEEVTTELSHGHKVIVAVDSGDLWYSKLPFYSLFHSHGADHAVVLTGLDMSDPSDPKVFINDPGDPGGAGKPYPLDQFLEAWGCSANTYVATDSAPSGLVDHLIFGANFHPETGMYMDPNFWTAFLEEATTAVPSLAHDDKPWHPRQNTDNDAKPGQQGVEHKGLF